jgi:AraC-like DNA-binding protein
MSRASFAAHFRQVVGVTSADYLTNWRISLAQSGCARGCLSR